jgi:hypothetical protein
MAPCAWRTRRGPNRIPESLWRRAFALFRHLEALVDGPSERVIPGVPDTSFRREWKHFADCIPEKKEPRRPLSNGLAALDLAVALI